VRNGRAGQVFPLSTFDESPRMNDVKLASFVDLSQLGLGEAFMVSQASKSFAEIVSDTHESFQGYYQPRWDYLDPHRFLPYNERTEEAISLLHGRVMDHRHVDWTDLLSDVCMELEERIVQSLLSDTSDDIWEDFSFDAENQVQNEEEQRREYLDGALLIHDVAPDHALAITLRDWLADALSDGEDYLENLFESVGYHDGEDELDDETRDSIMEVLSQGLDEQETKTLVRLILPESDLDDDG